MSDAVLSVEQARKSFGRLTAVDSVNLKLRPGHVVGLIGPNGSGKTTMVNLISGAFPFDEGRLLLDDHDATNWPAHKRCHWGLARTNQVVRPFGQMTVFENVLVTALFGAGSTHTTVEAARIADRVLEEVGLSDASNMAPRDLPIQRLKRLELARALAAEPKVLLLDEVLAGLTHGETERIIELMRVKRQEGLAILFIEHRVQTVLDISDSIVVLDEGKTLAEGSPSEIANNPAVMHAYMGLAPDTGDQRGNSDE